MERERVIAGALVASQVIPEHYRNAMHWRQNGVGACGQRTAHGNPITRHCSVDLARVTCRKCLRLAESQGYRPPVAGQLPLDLTT